MTDDLLGRRPAATVVITNHNYGRFLDQAIHSALAQRDVHVEVIVVDDGSDDESHDVLAQRRTAITAVRQPNLGQGAAINTGFLFSRGEVVLFLDADDVLDVDVVARCCDAFAKDPGAVRVQFVLRGIGAAGDDLGTTVPADPRRLPRGDCRAAILSRADDLPWQPTSGNAFRATALARVLPMPDEQYRICADHHLSNLTPLLGTVLVLDKPGGRYRVHGSNADHRVGFDLERTRGIIVRTIATHDSIARLATEEGLIREGELDIKSVTSPASRLVSLRLDRAAHPIEGDRRAALVAEGLRAAKARQDINVVRRFAIATWFVVAASAPKVALRGLATVALRSSTQASSPGTMRRAWRRTNRGRPDPTIVP
ncbi:MAG: glycosyltransferase family 2 protein [Acidimicrobiales bacterium]